MSDLFYVLKAMIDKGKTDGLEHKIDIFYAAGKLTDEEYNILIELLKEK